MSDADPQPKLPDPAGGVEHDPRVVFASERTLLAWVRTGLALMGFGFVIARFGLYLRELAALRDLPASSPTHFSEYVGIVLVLLGVIVNVLAAVQHFGFIRRYNRGELPRPGPVSAGFVLSLLLAGVGLGLAGYLFWMG